MTAGQKKNIERLKKLQSEAKKLKKANPKLTHIEAIKIAAGKKIGATKKTVSATKKKKSIPKITERVVLTQAHKVKAAANKLDELQHEHMLQKSIGKMSEQFLAVFSSNGKTIIQKFKSTSLVEAKKLATKFKKLYNLKGTVKVSKFLHL
jgi:2-methylaconitate cis-trans-isomerase PrpF